MKYIVFIFSKFLYNMTFKLNLIPTNQKESNNNKVL